MKTLKVEFREEVEELLNRLTSALELIIEEGVSVKNDPYDTTYNLNRSAHNLLNDLERYNEYH